MAINIREFLVSIRVEGTRNLSNAYRSAEELNNAMDHTGRGAGTVDRNLKGVGKATNNATREFSKMSQGLGGLVHVYALIAANVFAATSAFTALRETAKIEQLTQSMNAFATATGVATGQIVGDLKRITDSALTTREAMTVVAQATAAGFSGMQIKEIVQVATDASKVLGRDLSDSIDRLTRGITKLEPELLDEIGIMTRVDEATTKYADKVGKAASNLTSFEKRMAFANAALEEGRTKFGLLGENIDVNPYDKVAASIRNIAESFAGPALAIGKFFEDLTANIVGVIALLGVLGTKLAVKTLPNFADQARARVEGLKAGEEALRSVLEKERLKVRSFISADPNLVQAKQDRLAAVQAAEASKEQLRASRFSLNAQQRAAVASQNYAQIQNQLVINTEKLIKLEAKANRTAEVQRRIDRAKALNAVLQSEADKLKAINRELEIRNALEASASSGVRNVQEQIDVVVEKQGRAELVRGIAETTETLGVTEGLKSLFAIWTDPAATQGMEGWSKGTARVAATTAFLGAALNTFVGVINKALGYIGLAITVFTLLKQGYDSVREAAGLSSEEITKANDSFNSLNKTIEQLSNTTEYYDALVSKGFYLEALKQRANTVTSIFDSARESIVNTTTAIVDLDRKSRDIQKRRQEGTLTIFEDLSDFIAAGFSNTSGTEARFKQQQKLILENTIPSIETSLTENLNRFTNIEDRAVAVAKIQKAFKNVGIQIDDVNGRLVVTTDSAEKLVSSLDPLDAQQKLSELSEVIRIDLSNSLIGAATAATNLADIFSRIGKRVGEELVSGLDNSLASFRFTESLNLVEELKAVDQANVVDILGIAQRLDERTISLYFNFPGVQESLTSLQNFSEEYKQIDEQVKKAEEERNRAVQRGQAETARSLLNRIETGELVKRSGRTGATQIEVPEEIREQVFSNQITSAEEFLTVIGIVNKNLESTGNIISRQGTRFVKFDGRAVIDAERQSLEQVKKLEKDRANLGDRIVAAGKALRPVLEDSLETIAQSATQTVNLETAQERVNTAIKVQESAQSNTLASASNLLKLQNESLSIAIQRLDTEIQTNAEQANATKDAGTLEVLRATRARLEAQRANAAVAIQINNAQIQVNTLLEDTLGKQLDYNTLEAELLEILNKQPEAYQLINGYLDQARRLRELDLNNQKASLDYSIRELQAREALSNLITPTRLVPDISATMEEFRLRQEQIDLEKRSRRDILNSALAAERAKSAVDQNSLRIAEIISELNQLDITAQRDATLLDYERKQEIIKQSLALIELQNKFPPMIGEENRAAEQIWYSIGQTFREDIQQSMGFVEGAANVFSSSLDSSIDAFVDGIIEGKNVLESVTESLRQSLIQGFGDLAKDQIKLGVKTLLLEGLPEKFAEQNPALEGFLKAFGVEDTEATERTRASYITGGSTLRDVVTAIQSINISSATSVAPPGITLPTDPGVTTVDLTGGSGYPAEKSLSTISEQSTAQTGFLSKLNTGVKNLFNITKAGDEYMADAFVGGIGSLATVLLSGQGGKKALASSILGFAGSVIGAAFGPMGSFAGGQIGAMLGTRFEDGGIMTSSGAVPLRAYARGGVADSPQLAMFGEGSMPEAYVPLPDGRSIPVSMEGGTGAGNINNISINVAVDNKGSTTQSTSSGDKTEDYSKKLGVAISNAVKVEIANQQRPGGILYRGRR